MTFITHGFRVSVVSDVRERVRDNDNSNKGTTARLNEKKTKKKKRD
jgi:hypothetical protein